MDTGQPRYTAKDSAFQLKFGEICKLQLKAKSFLKKTRHLQLASFILVPFCLYQPFWKMIEIEAISRKP